MDYLSGNVLVALISRSRNWSYCTYQIPGDEHCAGA